MLREERDNRRLAKLLVSPKRLGEGWRVGSVYPAWITLFYGEDEPSQDVGNRRGRGLCIETTDRDKFTISPIWPFDAERLLHAITKGPSNFIGSGGHINEDGGVVGAAHLGFFTRCLLTFTPGSSGTPTLVPRCRPAILFIIFLTGSSNHCWAHWGSE